ncbi:MAG: acylneuraminate cytidylyltransferase family protein, partial [Bacteroidota bacterium]|nr:acylneuraminate cytidylyltransferase family protein [Bacteroidota bacterium]
MFKKEKILAIIPARGGSKGLKDKNIINLAGKPLIAWTIEVAQNSKYIDEIFVSTDSEKIQKTVENFGLRIPFLRPEHLSTDNSKSIDVIFHVLDYYSQTSILFQHFILLQPTSPLRTVEDIDNAIELYFQKKAEAVVSVRQVSQPPYLMNTIADDLNMKDFINKKVSNSIRQEMPDYYWINGAIYLANVNFYRENKSLYGDKTFAYIMPKERSVDIDEKIDLLLAEQLLKLKKA